MAQVCSVNPTPRIHRNAPALDPWVGPKLGEWEKRERDAYLPRRLLNLYREEWGRMEPTCPVTYLGR